MNPATLGSEMLRRLHPELKDYGFSWRIGLEASPSAPAWAEGIVEIDELSGETAPACVVDWQGWAHVPDGWTVTPDGLRKGSETIRYWGRGMFVSAWGTKGQQSSESRCILYLLDGRHDCRRCPRHDRALPG